MKFELVCLAASLSLAGCGSIDRLLPANPIERGIQVRAESAWCVQPLKGNRE